jgi:hypothetical protein
MLLFLDVSCKGPTIALFTGTKLFEKGQGLAEEALYVMVGFLTV